LLDCELITLISAIACAIIKCNDEDTISILAVSLTQLGDTLATFLTQKDIMDKRAQECEDKRKENRNKGYEACKENEE
jgi:hypothetical protein